MSHVPFKPHFIAGLGDLVSGLSLAPNQTGHMADFGGTSNDPFFIVHHTMVDCILLEWLILHPDAEYPTAQDIRTGHGSDDYPVPFFPRYTNAELFGLSNKFGYSCRLAEIPEAAGGAMGMKISSLLMLFASVTLSWW
jgi:hypothetical protein